MTTTHRPNGVNGSSSSNAEGADGEELSVGAVFAALKHPHRRYVLYYLSDQSEGASAAELVEWIADCEAEAADGANRTLERERVAVALHHTHLPKLDDLGLVDHDRDEDRVTRREGTTGVEPYLEFAAEYERIAN